MISHDFRRPGDLAPLPIRRFAIYGAWIRSVSLGSTPWAYARVPAYSTSSVGGRRIANSPPDLSDEKIECYVGVRTTSVMNRGPPGTHMTSWTPTSDRKGRSGCSLAVVQQRPRLSTSSSSISYHRGDSRNVLTLLSRSPARLDDIPGRKTGLTGTGEVDPPRWNREPGGKSRSVSKSGFVWLRSLHRRFAGAACSITH